MFQLKNVLFLAFAFPAEAETLIGTRDNVDFATKDQSFAYFQTQEESWSVACSVVLCTATSDWLTLRARQDGISIASVEQGTVIHYNNRTSLTLQTDKLLDPYELATLVSRGYITRLKDEDATIGALGGIAAEGLHVVLEFMVGVVSPGSGSELVDWRALEGARRTGAAPQLMPFTKPQIEFAVRAQTTQSE